MIAALKSQGVPVLWVGVPAVHGQKSTADMRYLDDMVHARVERAGMMFVNPWDGFVDESGRYVTQGPDFEGQIRRLRTGDGVHFTKFGAVKLAQYVAQDLRRVLCRATLCRWHCRLRKVRRSSRAPGRGLPSVRCCR